MVRKLIIFYVTKECEYYFNYLVWQVKYQSCCHTSHFSFLQARKLFKKILTLAVIGEKKQEKYISDFELL